MQLKLVIVLLILAVLTFDSGEGSYSSRRRRSISYSRRRFSFSRRRFFFGRRRITFYRRRCSYGDEKTNKLEENKNEKDVADMFEEDQEPDQGNEDLDVTRYYDQESDNEIDETED